MSVELGIVKILITLGALLILQKHDNHVSGDIEIKTCDP